MPETSQPTSLDALHQRWKVDPTPQLSLHLADELGRHNRQAEAVEVLEQTLRAHPEHVAALVALGRLRLVLGQQVAASQVLEKVVTDDPTHLVANKLLVNLYLDLGKEKQARDRLDLYALLNESDPDIEQLERKFAPYVVFRLPSLPPPPPDLATLEPTTPAGRAAEVVAAAPTRPAARPLVTPAADPFPEVWEGIGDGDYWRRIAAEGIFPLPADTAVPPPEPVSPTEDATVTIAELYLQQGHLQEAASTFREVLEREPENVAAREGLEEIELQLAPPVIQTSPAAQTPPAAQVPPVAEDGEVESKERKARALKRYLRRLRTGADEKDH
ncbi:MAG: tetratricopeptide repeat protein [Thermoanaerobaculia bacterium]